MNETTHIEEIKKEVIKHFATDVEGAFAALEIAINAYRKGFDYGIAVSQAQLREQIDKIRKEAGDDSDGIHSQIHKG